MATPVAIVVKRVFNDSGDEFLALSDKVLLLISDGGIEA